EHHDLLAVRARPAERVEEAAAVDNPFEIAAQHVRLRIVGDRLDDVDRPDVRFVAGADHEPEPDTSRLGDRVCPGTESTALGDHPDVAGQALIRAAQPRGERATEAERRVDQAQAVGAEHAYAGAGRRALEVTLALFAFGAPLGEPTRPHDRRADPEPA